jgi:hypothetical protein
MSNKVVAIAPHSLERAQLQALESTLSMLPCGGTLRKNAEGEFDVADGRVFCECANPDFLVFAVTRQGYAKAAEIVDV